MRKEREASGRVLIVGNQFKTLRIGGVSTPRSLMSSPYDAEVDLRTEINTSR